jgi:hypothetical protein
MVERALSLDSAQETAFFSGPWRSVPTPSSAWRPYRAGTIAQAVLVDIVP